MQASKGGQNPFAPAIKANAKSATKKASSITPAKSRPQTGFTDRNIKPNAANLGTIPENRNQKANQSGFLSGQRNPAHLNKSVDLGYATF